MNLLKRVAALVPALAIIALCAVPQYGYAQPAPVPRNDVGQTGNITYQTGTVVLGLNADSTCSIEVAGTFVGTLQFQGAIAAGSAFALPSLPVSGTASVTTTTGTGRWFTGCGGLSQISVVATAWTSGKATVTLIGSMGSNFSSIGNAALSTVAQGTAAASSASWPFFLYGLSGTNQQDVDSNHRALITPCGTIAASGSGNLCAMFSTLNQALGPTNNGQITLSQLYGEVQGSTNVNPVLLAPSPAPVGVLAQGYNSNGGDAPVLCKQVAIVNSITTATTTLLIAAVTNKKVYICGYHIGGLLTVAGTAKLIYGTQATTPCDTSATAASAIHELAAASDDLMPVSFANGLAAPISPASSQACVVTTGTLTRFSISVSYEQF